MSDAGRAPGDPVEEPRPTDDDVVVRANQGLADAEAAQRGSSSDEGSTTDARAARADGTDAAASEHRSAGVPGSSYTPPAADRPSDAGDTGRSGDLSYIEAASARSDAPTDALASDAPARSSEHAPVTASEPASGAEPVAGAAFGGPQHIFVQAPEPPRARGNRAAAGLIGLLAALSFAALYLACALAFGLLDGTYTLFTLVDGALSALQSWWLWTATVVFFLGFWLLGAIINTGRWGHWVIWGLLLGFVAYGAHLVGQLFQAPFWQLTRTEGAELIEAQVVAPLAFAAFVIGRELTIWYGAWIAARGRRVRELNETAQREYERTLEAGPQLVRS
ncbi:ABC transporter [Microbacterium sp. NPDC078428]|uniref:ABC transporter n=1 Tax=Microbacterium sp. NPDC078428 TaxID=3364190 RepID=UPI0037C8C95E